MSPSPLAALPPAALAAFGCVLVSRARRAGVTILLALLPALLLHAAPAPAPPRPPKLSVASGLFTQPFTLEFESREPGLALRYTTNGSRPTLRNSAVAQGPLPVDRTTVLRAAAFAPDGAVSKVVTRTYLFPHSTLTQTGAGFPNSWGVREGAPVPADYAMDPEVTEHPAYRNEIGPALLALPSVSLVFEPADLFESERGLYAHPMETGSEWERPVTLQVLDRTHPSDPVDAGIRIQGGWNRRPEESPKHAFRIAFRKKYGPGQWKHPLFGPQAPIEFDDLILRAGCNNTWLHWSAEERVRGDYLRDQWMRDSLAAMGHPSARGRFVHLYLNGLYWGVYNLTERPSAPFAAAHFGGNAEDYDARNAGNPIEGDDAAWKELIRAVETVPPPAGAFAALERLVDMPEFIDYILLNLYGANGDLDGASNWYAARRRTPPGPFRFFVWDGERTLEKVEASILGEDPGDSPLRVFQRLRAHPEFRRLFAERARRHLTGEGALTPSKAAARYEALTRLVETALVAESARWGDYRRDAHPYKVGPYALYTRDDHWRPEVRRLLDAYFPRRTEALIRDLTRAGLMDPSN